MFGIFENTTVFKGRLKFKFEKYPEYKEGGIHGTILNKIILDLGLTLDLKIEEKEINSSKVFFVSGDALVACFDDNISDDTFKEIAKTQPLKVVFKDSSFAKTEEKINLETIFKEISSETKITVI